MKEKTIWCCQECGNTQAKWSGCCPACEQWNTIVEEAAVPVEDKRFTESTSKPVAIGEIKVNESIRVATKLDELDRLFGGGLIPGSLTLIGGEPGIGKSTLMLQLSDALAKQGLTVLYICGEESIEQTSLRAQRLGIKSPRLFLYNETSLNHIKAEVDKLNPDFLIVDSVQVIYKNELASAPGSVSQVREIATEFMHLSKTKNITTFLIGHVTKSGEIAGPRVLEHIVDTVLEFEGSRQHGYRLLRSIKNRFGATDQIALFQMDEAGLKEVGNPSEIFLQERSKEANGSVVVPTIEGSRSFLIEVQALVAPSAYSTPSRRSTGLDQNRLALLLAVLEKKMNYRLFNTDVFVSVAGGMKITEPAIDLGVLLAIASSIRDKKIPFDTAVIGEVGLGGEVRSVPRIETRIKEAMHMGFSRLILPKRCTKNLSSKLREKIELIGVNFVEEAIRAILS